MEAELQFGRLRGLRSVLLRRYEHRPLVRCLRGLSGCRWGPHGSGAGTGAESGAPGCTKGEGLGVALLAAAFCVSLVFLYFWGQAKNDYNDFDWFTFGGLGFWFPWSVVLLVVTASFFTYLCALMLLLLCLMSERQTVRLHCTHKVLVSLVLLFSVCGLSVLSDLWSKEWTTLLLSFQVTAPYLHVGGVLLMTVLSWPVAAFFCGGNGSGRGRSPLLVLFLLSLCVLYLLPLGLYSPCIKERSRLGPRPALIGHRGAPMLAPENTLMSFEKAVQSGCEGLETDVTLSLDGMPFLMHDRTLLRTTNVSEEFPESIRTPAAWFTWAQLQRLNAGAWFLKSDPFRSAGALSEEERVRAQNQTVCSLLHFLELAARSHSLVIFDLYRPPKDHPYRDTWIQRTLDVLNQSTMPSEQVLWLPSDLRSLVQETDPDLQQTSGSRLPLEELQSNNIVKLNLHYSAASPQLVREYSSVNVSVNLYVVSEPWLFSVAWCCGVQSVTTNAPQLLSHMTQPLLLMSPAQYRVMWTLTDLLSVALVLLVFFFHWWRERALTFSSGSKVTLDTGSYSKFPTELSEVWSVSSVSSQGPPPGAALPSS